MLETAVFLIIAGAVIRLTQWLIAADQENARRIAEAQAYDPDTDREP